MTRSWWLLSAALTATPCAALALLVQLHRLNGSTPPR